MENDQAGGFRQLEEECREMAKRASWINEALSRPPRNGVDGTERKLTNACQYVESAVEELRSVVHRVRQLEAAFLEAQTTAAERDQAAAGAAAKVRDAEMRMAAADLKAEEAAETISAANLKAAAAEASMNAYDELKRKLKDEREAMRKEKEAFDIRVKRAREMELQTQSLERQRDEAKRDVARFNVIRDDLVTEKDTLKRERKTLEGDLVKYNEAVAEYSQLKSKMAEEVRQEKARVGRRDETIASLKRDILKMESDHTDAMNQVVSDMRIAQMQTRMSSEYKELARKMDEMKISQEQSMTNLPPNTRAVKGLEKQVDDMKKQVEDMKQQLQRTEAVHSERRREDAEAAEKHRGLLVQEYDSQIREEHQKQLQELRTTKEAELADLRQRLETQLEELRTTKEAELAGVRQQLETQLQALRTTKEELGKSSDLCESRLQDLGTKDEELANARQRSEKEINTAQTRADDLQLMVDQLQRDLEEKRTPSASPGPKRKKPRADDSQPRPQTPPPSAPEGQGAKGAELTKWQAAQQSESEFWSSFEPRLFDPSEDLSYEVLLHSLRKAARDEVTRSRFMAFVQSDVTGWHCVERVVDPGSESAVQPVDGKCTLKRHKKAGECLRMRRIGGRNVDFQYMKNR